MTILEAILLLLAGVGVFIAGMNMLSDGLERSAGGGLKKMLGKISGNRFAGVGVGAGVTAIIQSSSATSVMVIGFVNAGIMNLFQATSILMGAKIGTTITGILVSLQDLPISDFVMLLAFVGVMMTFIKNEKVKQIGVILCGFGLIFVGLDLMGSSLKNSADINNFFKDLFKSIDLPLLLVLFGMLFTAIIQSSSAATGIFITMVAEGALQLDCAIFLVLGANIGTCITAVIASMGAGVDAKRAAFILLTFNIIGAVLFTSVLWPLRAQAVSLLQMLPGGAHMQLAWFHVIFNVTTVVILLPFIKELVRFACFVVKDKPVEESGRTLHFVDERFLKTPPIAVMQVKKEIEYMAMLAGQNLADSFKAMEAVASDYSAAITEKEADIDFINHSLTKYLIKLSPLVSGKDERKIGAYFHVLNDLERIGDHADNFCEIGIQMQEKGLEFSDTAKEEIKQMQACVLRMFEIASEAFEGLEKDHLGELTQLENQVDGFKKELSAAHYARLAEGRCKVEHSPYFTSIIAGLERVADHLVNFGYSVLNPTGSQSEARREHMVEVTE